MYICPTCNKGFEEEEKLTKHFLSCWKEAHPYHKGKSASRGEDIITREDNQDILNFFNSLK